jgi:type IV pilus assembly protein PilY1
VLANLGGASFAAPTLQQNRRFYNAPDPVLISYRGSIPFFNIGIGTGYRGHPLETDTQDRIYAVRDFNVYNTRTTASYTVAATIIESQLVDVTTNMATVISPTAAGWYIRLNQPSWRGEKVLGESLTVGGVMFIPTFTPLAPDPSSPCLARTQNRMYAMYAVSGKAFFNWDNSAGPLTISDRSTILATGGIAPGLSIFADPIGSTSSSSTSSSSSSTSSSGGDANCVSGVSPVRCVPFGNVNRSFWEHR